MSLDENASAEYYLIFSGIYECIDRYHQDWACREKTILKICSSKDKFYTAWNARPVGWYESNPGNPFAEEGEVALEWTYEVIDEETALALSRWRNVPIDIDEEWY